MRSYNRRQRRPTDRRRTRAHIHAAERPAAVSAASIIRLALVVLADPGVRERLLEIYMQATKGGPR